MAIIHMNFRSDCISRSVYPTVFLPDLNHWRDVEPPYPTLYFLPGYSGGGLETAMFSNFHLYAMRYGVAVVLVDGENSFYTDDEQRGAMFSRFVGEKLPAVTRSVLPLSSRREDTFIGGISMGGYGSLINGMRFRETFSKIAMLSPAMGFKRPDDCAPEGSPSPSGELMATMGAWKDYCGSYRDYSFAVHQAFQNPADMPQMFLACGLSDRLSGAIHAFMDDLHDSGIPLSVYEAEGGHDHTFWKKALDPAFRFLTGKEGV